MTIRRHGHTITQMPNGIAVQLANGDRHFIINAKMPEPNDYRAQDAIIFAAGKPSDEPSRV